MSVIETPFGFFEVGKEGIGADTAQPGQTGFGVAPERFNAIDVAASPGEFVGAMMNPIMLVAFENQAVVSAPSIGKMILSLAGETCPLIIWRSSAFEQLGKGEQMTLPPLLRSPTTGIFLDAPRPRMPRTLRGPK